MLRLSGAVLLLFLAHLNIAAQGDELSLHQIRNEIRTSGYDSGEIQSLEELFIKASGEALPLNPLYGKLRLGLAKGVPFPRLLPVLQADLLLMQEVAVLLDDPNGGMGYSDSRGPLISRMLLLRRQNFEVDEINQLLLAAADEPSLDAGTLVLLELRDWDIPQKESLDLSLSLMRSPLPWKEYGYIIPLLKKGLSGGYSLADLVSEIIDYSPDLSDFSDLEAILGL